MSKLLEVRNLKTSFYTHLGEVQAVRGISFDLERGKVLGIVGESGSGKSVSALSVMGLVDDPGEIVEGSITLHGLSIPELAEHAIGGDETNYSLDLTKLSPRELTRIRGNEISMIFQDPMTSLNPVYSIKNQMVEVILRHTDLSKEDALNRAIELLKMVGIPEPEERIKAYPHQFSGGMRQRAMIATALSCNPKLLIADEPTTALDVTIQAQILELLRELKDKINTSIIFITHDLGVISEICDDVIVMYGGMMMEKGTVREIFHNPSHPYTKGLQASIPKVHLGARQRLIPIDGSPPDLMNPPSGCPFSPRCPHAMEICLKEAAPLFPISETQHSACWLMHEDAPEVPGFKTAKEAK